jgi:hypothetical protein
MMPRYRALMRFRCIRCALTTVDYEVTRKDTYLLPRVDNTLDELKDAFFTHTSTSPLASGKFECVIKTSARLHFKPLMA